MNGIQDISEWKRYILTITFNTIWKYFDMNHFCSLPYILYVVVDNLIGLLHWFYTAANFSQIKQHPFEIWAGFLMKFNCTSIVVRAQNSRHTVSVILQKYICLKWTKRNINSMRYWFFTFSQPIRFVLSASKIPMIFIYLVLFENDLDFKR